MAHRLKKNVAGIASRHKHEDIPSHQGDPFLSDEIATIVPNFPAVVRGEIWVRSQAFGRDDELGHDRTRDKCNVGM